MSWGYAICRGTSGNGAGTGMATRREMSLALKETRGAAFGFGRAAVGSAGISAVRQRSVPATNHLRRGRTRVFACAATGKPCSLISLLAHFSIILILRIL